MSRYKYDSYEQYARITWDRYVSEPERIDVALEGVKGLEFKRVLDIGSAAGQQLLPYVVHRKAWGVGLDPLLDAGIVGSKLYAEQVPEAKIDFVCGDGNTLPFSSGSFDLVICRLVLSFMDNERAISEMARVLEPGGSLLLKILHPRYYLRRFREGLMAFDPIPMVYSTRVLAAGIFYHMTGRQPKNRLTAGGEVFQTERFLRRLLESNGLKIRRELLDTEKETPSFLIVKE
ncbi:MAG TPA: class I SAM-dependent methyltransferase [Pyrinomonadaceae bacterium]|jgi:SAM-dependent methyltransferase